MGGILLDLLAQTADVDGDGAGVERRRVAPDPIHELLAGEDLLRVAGEEPEQVELAAPSAGASSPAGVTSRVRASISRLVEREALGLGDARARRGAAPCAPGRRARAERRAWSRSRRRRARARRCGRSPRRGPSAGSRAGPSGADPAAELEPVDAGEHHVEDHEAGRLASRPAGAPCRRRPPRACGSRRARGSERTTSRTIGSSSTTRTVVVIQPLWAKPLTQG